MKLSYTFNSLPQAHQAVVKSICDKQAINTNNLEFKHLQDDEFEMLDDGKPTTYCLFFNNVELD